MKQPIGLVGACLVLIFTLTVCGHGPADHPATRNYRKEMRDFVKKISAYAKAINPDFIVIPQNGNELLIQNGAETGLPDKSYIRAIDGVGQESLFYGYPADNQATPISARNYLLALLKVAQKNGLAVLVTDYCWTRSLVDDAYSRNAAQAFIGFAADHRLLDHIPAYPFAPFRAHASGVGSLAEAKNFLYLVNPAAYDSKEAFLRALRGTDHDLLVIDLFIDGRVPLSADEVSSLKRKSTGHRRLVIAYLSIGEAEDYRYYWRRGWRKDNPSWLAAENPAWPGNFKVRYWDPDWQRIIVGNDDAYLKKIIDAGFDGVYLDIIDAFEYFENLPKS